MSQNNGIGIGFGLQPENYGWVTIHSCEEYCKVPYRFYKTFKGRKKEKHQKVFEKVFVRKNRFKNTNNLKKILNFLKKNKKIEIIQIKNIKISKINLNTYFNIGVNLLKNKFALIKKL